jgi:SAM-dependent MidA family methyltransferase
MASATPRLTLPEPPPELRTVSRSLLTRMRDVAEDKGRLSFAEFMEMALYEPGLGYYSAGLAKFGEGGDFVTAPELAGPDRVGLFAGCLARPAAALGERLGSDWSILELGAGTGRLAADLLRALERMDAPLPASYQILERSADLRARQGETLERLAPRLAGRVSWLDRPPESDWNGLLLANEVIDALAVERFRLTEDGPVQVGVIPGGDGLRWTDWPADEALAARIATIRADLPEPLLAGYTSELCTTLPAWLDAVTASLTRGAALFIDYGYPRPLYYHPERREGTLVCHYRHRAHFDPLLWPGLQDISAFVDFTALAEAADAAGLEVAGYTPQNRFLIEAGLEPLAAGLADLPPRERQALGHELRELTLPGAMGEKFQVMALTRGVDGPLPGFGPEDWRGRL